MLLGERLPRRPRVPRGTRERRGLKAKRRGYRLSLEDPLGPAGLGASGARPTRVSPDAPACEPSQPPSTSPPIPKLPPRRCSRDSRCATQRPDAPGGQERRGVVRSTHGARARPQDVSESLEALARKLSSNRLLSRGERSYPSMSLAELRLRSRLRAALSMRPARCRNGTV